MLLISILVFTLHNKERIWRFEAQSFRSRNEEQVINRKKDNTNASKINRKSEISVITNWINNDFENIYNERHWYDMDMESNKHIRENAEEDVRTK